ncbi:hypothetical protein [Haloarchaeobius litoreus]|uniref:Uncharacterized protein n=1 Tax=Haloarchaeobius litoreus TaxID=755306 RepID=A0ABD6DP37_9EURY|nr:hypothetical protein [Haloarchaeobius litoreus]
MDRRVFIRALAVAGATAVAGCSEAPGGTAGGDDGDDGGSTDDDGGSGGGDGGSGGSDDDGSDGDGSSDETGEHIRAAVGMLNRVGYRLSELQSQLEEEPTSVEVDTEETLAAIDAARSDLDAAAEGASADQQATIETLRALATVLESMTRLVDLLSTVDVDGRLNEVQTTVEAGNYDEALAQVREAKARAEEADAHVTAAEEAAAEIEPARLEAVDAVSYDELEPSLTAASRLVDALLAMTEGYEAILLGREDLVTAQEALDDREYDVAEAALSDAEAQFTAADEAFAGIENAPSSIATHLDRSRCQSEHLVAATEHFRQAAAAARDGDAATAREQRDAAEADLQRVDEC